MVAETPIRKKECCPKATAVWALTDNGACLAVRIANQMEDAALFVGKSVENAPVEATRFESLSEAADRKFREFSAHVFVMAAGIVVRVIAPHVKDKRSDPAVVVVDDAGQFAISLLSGHLGGANALAKLVARTIGALPVVTTATDVNRVPALDMLASKHGLLMENPDAVKTVGMAFLNGERIRLRDPYDILGRDLGNWSVPEKDGFDETRAGVCIDHFVSNLPGNVLVLRPKTLSVGVGCNRNTPAEEILEAVRNAFDRFHLSIDSINNIATIDAKADEPGMLGLADILKARLVFFGKEELSRVDRVPNPSMVVKKHMGVVSVCEAAAILASGTGRLLASKQKTRNVTVAIAAKPFTWWESAPEARIICPGEPAKF